MPRMSKKRRLEWSFFLRQVKVGNTTCDRITYNDLCRGCTHSCKQSFRAVIILCPHYYSKRRKKEDRDNGRYKEKYESRIADLAVEMEQLEDGLRTMDTQIEQHRALEQDAAQIKTDRALTGALIERLIDRIEVSHDKQITVRYRFQSEFETYAEVLKQCRNM